MKRALKSRNTTKIADLLQDLRISPEKLRYLLRELRIYVEEGQKNLDQNEVGRIRQFLNDQRKREELRGRMIRIPSIIKVPDLAVALKLPIGEVLGALLKNGVMATINHEIDYETAAIVASDLGYQTEESVQALEKDVLTPEKLDEILKKEDPAEQQDRPPVVTIMGHVDHGKTTLLDSIRQGNVAAQEAGGITQAISSYQAEYKGRKITFIDTPGHETFQFMRQRGANLADIAVLVVAADDGVKPQTKEALNHAKAAQVPIVVAINKVDKAEANIEKVKRELSDLELLPEEWGGQTVMVPVSALKKQGLDQLLEMILLTADLHPPRANANRPALGTVIESNLDNNLGPMASLLVQTGTLKTGDYVIVGRVSGRIRRLLDFNGQSIPAATPGMPVTIIGLEGVPQAGEVLQAVEAREEARQKAALGRAPVKTVANMSDDERPSLALVLKADSRGSLEAIEQTIKAMVPPEIRLAIARSEVGHVSDSDVLTAKAAGGIVYAFKTRIAGMTAKLAEKERVPVKLFDVIYHLAEDIRGELEKRLPMEIVQRPLGRFKVLKVFFSTQRKKIVGGDVAQGSIENNAKIVIWRKEEGETLQVGNGTVLEIQKEKRAVDQAQMGDQVGITIEGKGKIKEGDVLEVYKEEKVRKKFD